VGIFEAKTDGKIPRLDFELMTGCDHACGHCYNVWTAEEGDAQAGYVKGHLKPAEYLAMMEKAVTESGAEMLTITGGEPLLRKDALDIIDKACELAKNVLLITNGSHVDPETCARFAKAGVASVQLTLLSADRDKHNKLKGADCFDDTVRAALNLRDAGVHAQVCFVAMRQNWMDFADVMELCMVLGIDSIAYNRMSPTGGAIHNIQRLLPEVAHVESNLDTAEQLGPRWKIRVSTAMPIPPCLVRIERYEWVKFGFCSTGTHSPNIVIDPMGNVRSCNLASGLMGNVLEQDFASIMANPYQREFKKNVPEMCRGCRYETSCQGGCKESAFATFGDHAHPEPFVHMAMNPAPAAKKSLAVIGSSGGGSGSTPPCSKEG
jgi:pyrroloquinoline quinone biosynthesis protein E